MKRLFIKLSVLIVLAGAVGTVVWFLPATASGTSGDYRTAKAERREFRQVVRRQGSLKPVNEVHIFAQVSATIVELAEQGKVVQKDDVVLKLDTLPFEIEKTNHEAQMAQEEAEFKKTSQEGMKSLDHAKADVESCNLLVELEQQRLVELKKGPTPIDQVNAEVALQNNKSLLDAKKDEVAIYESLLAGGYESQAVVRQKRLELTQQQLKVTDTDIALRKLDRLDPVKIAEQELKVKDAIKQREAATDQVSRLERSILRDQERHKQLMDREKVAQRELEDELSKCTVRAPAPGLVVHKRNRWYTFAPGRSVFDGIEVMSLPDFSKMKAIVAVDEGRIGSLQVGQSAFIQPAGCNGKPFNGKVTKIAEKCRDEFESFHDETSAIFGAANRQVFEVEVEIDGSSPVLRPGLRAEVEIVLQKLPGSVVIPRSALQRKNDNVFVRVDHGGAIEHRKIKILAENDLEAAVDGVQENERVWVVSE